METQGQFQAINGFEKTVHRKVIFGDTSYEWREERSDQ